MIYELAKRLINLSGMEVKDNETPDGDIEIIFTGLRPGEKLYEELLIGDNVSTTEHKQILRAEEDYISIDKLENYVELLKDAEKDGDVSTLRDILKEAVIGLTKSLGKETADKDIAVNCITPATAKTRILDQVSQEFIDYMISKIPRNRFVTVEEIASLISFLASKENSFTTAGVFDISGGRATY